MSITPSGTAKINCRGIGEGGVQSAVVYCFPENSPPLSRKTILIFGGKPNPTPSDLACGQMGRSLLRVNILDTRERYKFNQINVATASRSAVEEEGGRGERGTTRGVTVSMFAFLACHQCYCAGLSLAWGLNLRAIVCGIF